MLCCRCFCLDFQTSAQFCRDSIQAVRPTTIGATDIRCMICGPRGLFHLVSKSVCLVCARAQLHMRSIACLDVYEH